MDESERYTFATFTSFEAAIDACRQIVDEFLDESLKEGPLSAEAMYKGYVACGPDPFIQTDDTSVTGVPFSAWAYARELCSLRAAESGEPETGRQSISGA